MQHLNKKPPVRKQMFVHFVRKRLEDIFAKQRPAEYLVSDRSEHQRSTSTKTKRKQYFK